MVVESHIIPSVPTVEVLISMATRYDHLFFVDYNPDARIPMGYTPDQREGMLDQMYAIYAATVSGPLALKSNAQWQVQSNDIHLHPMMYDLKEDGRYRVGYSVESERVFQDKCAALKQQVGTEYVYLPAEPEEQTVSAIALMLENKSLTEGEEPNPAYKTVYETYACQVYDEMVGFKYPTLTLKN